MAERLNKDNFDSSVKAAGEKLVLADFYSDSCIPCKRMNPILGDIEDELGDKVTVYKLNVNFDAEVAQKYNVMSSPTLILFKNGQEVARKTGAQKKDDLISWLGEF